MNGLITGGGNFEKYSTNETIIGTWIDGKPLYRRVIKIDGVNMSTNTVIDSTLKSADVDTLVDIKGSVVNGMGDHYQSPYSPSYGVKIASTGVSIMFNSNPSGNYTFRKIRAIIEYTKTTD